MIVDKKAFAILFILGNLSFISCSEKDPFESRFFVDVSADSFDASGGSKSIALTSNISWSASSSQEWLTVTPASGSRDATLTITATENNTPAARTGVVTLTPETGDAIKVNISQVTNHEFRVDVLEVLLGPDDQEKATIELNSRTSWQATSSADWLTVAPGNGTGDATLALTASSNEEVNERSAIVTLTPDVGDAIEIAVTQGGVTVPDKSKTKDIEELLAQLGATKYISNCDFDANNKFKPYVNVEDPFSESIGTTLELTIDTETKYQGEGSYRLDYKFTGKNTRGGPQRVVIRQTWYDDYRSDLSFHPLGISLWVKSQKGNTNAITVRLLQQNEAFTLSNTDMDEFSYTDSTFLSQDDWNQLIIPYKWFIPKSENSTNTLNLRRINGLHVEFSNLSLEAEEGTIHVDAIQQLTSFVPAPTEPAVFSSIFVQLHDPTHRDYDWASLFQEYLEVGIDTLVVQRSVNYPGNLATFWYTGSSLSWKEREFNYLNQVFNAAENTGIKILLGLNQGTYPENKGNSAAYDLLFERNKELIDDLYEKFSESVAMAGWYICEEFHDGAWMGWHNVQNGILLSNYLNRVATYAKSKEKKFIVTMAPSLWRGRPADMTYSFYKRILEKTPEIDIMYLQDNGGRCYVDEDDYDVYLPQYFEMIKKACDEAGVQFGVDIESFEHCPAEGINWSRRSWSNLKQQLDMAGLYTKNISQFSWTTFRPGIGGFDEYKEYLRQLGLLKSQK